ncbi:MAG: hypothetical protein PHW26_03050 [Eubacteriales bacterium]|nr:hypothetical protein [Eubacteriales bacterium]
MEKRYKGILAVIFFFLLIAVATACNHEGDNSDVTARSGNQDIPVLEENEHSFGPLVSGKELEEIPYIQLGSDVTITFGGPVLSAVQFDIEDILLNMDGSPKYRKGLSASIDLVHHGNTVSFKLPTNPNAFLSSNSEDYLPGRTLRGFRLTFERDHQAFSYLLVLRTDAEKSGE